MTSWAPFVLASWLASAAPPAAGADLLLRAGESAYAAGQYLAAAQALEQAYELAPRAEIAYALARAYRLQYFVDQKPEHLDRAIVLYRIYVGETPRGGHRTDAATALAGLEPLKLRLDQERARTGALSPENLAPYEAPTQILVISEAQGARASLDGGAEADLPLVAAVRPGPHTVRVVAPGHFPLEEPIVAVEGRAVILDGKLRERPAHLVVRGDPGALVWLDGRPAGQLPLAQPIETSGGKHVLSVTRRGRVPWAREVEIARGASIEVQPELQMTFQREVSYYVMGGGTAILGAAGIFGIMALGDQQEATLLNDKRDASGITPSELNDYNRLVERRNERATAAWILAGTGAAIGVAGALLFYLERPIAMAPVPVGGAGGGVMFSGSF